ncbi:MAG: hypothetical protein R2698_01585 [Microthrixaceae bacterium]
MQGRSLQRSASTGWALVGWSVACLVVAVVRNRLWATPNLALFVEAARHLGSPERLGSTSGAYVLTNWSGEAFARLVGATTPNRYVLVHLGLAVAGLAVGVRLTIRRFGTALAAALAGVLAASPAVTVVFTWLGQPDALTLPLGLGVTIARGRVAAVMCAVALGATHGEQGVFLVLVAAAVRLAIEPFRLAGAAEGTVDPSLGPAGDEPVAVRGVRPVPGPSTHRWSARYAVEAVTLLAGVLVGRLAVEGYLRLAGLRNSAGRTHFLDIGVGEFLRQHGRSGVWLPLALWGVLWPAILAAATVVVRRRATMGGDVVLLARVLCASAVAAVVPMLITLDETRVYAMVTSPLLVGGAVLAVAVVDRLGIGVRPTVAAVTVVLVLVVPGVFTAGGVHRSTSLPPREFARFLLDGTVPGGADRLTPWLLGPFDVTVPTVSR